MESEPKFKAGDLIVSTIDGVRKVRLIIGLETVKSLLGLSYKVQSENGRKFCLSYGYCDTRYRVVPKDSLEYVILCP